MKKSENQSQENKLSKKIWDFINQMFPLLKNYKDSIQILKGDNIGIISLVL